MLYAFVYLRRFASHDRRQRFLALGMGLNRLVFAALYFYLTFADATLQQSQILVRWSLMCFLLAELAFLSFEYIERIRAKHEH